MPLSVSQFVRTAESSWFNNDVVLTGDSTLRSKFFHSKSTVDASREVNVATMNAFRAALEKEYGIMGEKVFDTLLGERAEAGRSLRKSDVRAVMKDIQNKQESIIGGLSAQCEVVMHKIIMNDDDLSKLSRKDQARLTDKVIGDMAQKMRVDNDYVQKLGELYREANDTAFWEQDADPKRAHISHRRPGMEGRTRGEAEYLFNSVFEEHLKELTEAAYTELRAIDDTFGEH